MSQKPAQVLVTGGLGYIGSHTVVELIQNGYECIIIDNLSNTTQAVVARIEEITNTKPIFIKGDVCKEDDLNSIFEQYDIEAVIHFAAKKSVNESVKDPISYYYNNVEGLITLLRVMQQNNVFSCVFSSSCTIYGEPQQLPVTENTPVGIPRSPYGNTKKIGEEILLDYTRSNSDAQVVALRYFNPVGAHPSSLIGELPLGTPNNLVPFITQAVAGLQEYLNVYGDDYDTPDGTPIRDYIHVVDVAQAHIEALKRIRRKETNANFESFNIGLGKGYSVMEMIAAFEKVTHHKVKYKIVGRRKGDIEKIYAATDYTTNILQWKAQRELEEMLSSAWDWQTKCKNSS